MGSVSGTGPGGTDQHAGILRTDVGITAEGSGGPLLNARGEAVGVATAIANPSGAFQSIGLGTGQKDLVVIEVRPNSPAAQAGLATGDVIREVNRLPVQAIADVERGLSRRFSQANEVLLRVERDGGERYVVLGAG